MKYQVPQFIEAETKLVGPLTLKQFLFVASGLAMLALEWIILRGIFFFVAAFPTIVFFAALAFARVDGQPFLNYLAYTLSYIFGSKKYVYRVGEKTDNPNNGK